VAAGIPIQIDVLEQVGTAGWSARIGCHTDDLGVCLHVNIVFHSTVINILIRVVTNFVDGHAFLFANL
jgi:hypothetical protein